MITIRHAVMVCALAAWPSLAIQATIHPATRETMMQANGTFDVKLLPGTVDSGAEGVSRMLMDKQFHGDLEGTSKGEMLSAGDPKTGNAGYVAIERVTGSLNGRVGSFALMQMAQMATGITPQLTMPIAPGSGTGDLSGIYGSMKIAVADRQHRYVLDYAFSSK